MAKVGKSGLERVYEKELTGTHGKDIFNGMLEEQKDLTKEDEQRSI